MATQQTGAPSARPIETVLVYGYGLMGHAVAKSFAEAGFETTVVSRRAAELDSLPQGVRAERRLPGRCPDLIIELVPEQTAMKQAIFAEVEAAYPDGDYLLATGTSGLDLVALSAPLARPERFIAIHYYMPADTVPVVEVCAGPRAPRSAVDRAAEALERAGKRPLRMYEPVVGFVANRLQHAILHEAYWMIARGIATAADIDFVATTLLGPRMCASGLVLQKDLSGLKVNADAQAAIVPHLVHNNVPCPIVPALVARGETGLAAGRGFYDWSGIDANAARDTARSSLARLLRFLEQEISPDAAKVRPGPRDLAAKS